VSNKDVPFSNKFEAWSLAVAYLSFSPWPTENGVVTAGSATPADASHFSTLELRVIGFAERLDATREIEHGSRLGRFLEKAFGVKLLRPLANPRLEKLRRFVSLAAHHLDHVTEAEIQQLVQAGYSPSQAYGLLAYLSGRGGRLGASDAA
jgi:hypothetical protein